MVSPQPWLFLREDGGLPISAFGRVLLSVPPPGSAFGAGFLGSFRSAALVALVSPLEEGPFSGTGVECQPLGRLPLFKEIFRVAVPLILFELALPSQRVEVGLNFWNTLSLFGAQRKSFRTIYAVEAALFCAKTVGPDDPPSPLERRTGPLATPPIRALKLKLAPRLPFFLFPCWSREPPETPPRKFFHTVPGSPEDHRPFPPLPLLFFFPF